MFLFSDVHFWHILELENYLNTQSNIIITSFFICENKFRLTDKNLNYKVTFIYSWPVKW